MTERGSNCLKQQLPELEGVQESTVWSILNERDIKPHRMSYYLVRKDPEFKWDEGTKNGPDRSALLGHNFVYQETKPHGFYSSYFHQRISS